MKSTPAPETAFPPVTLVGELPRLSVSQPALSPVDAA